MIGAIASKNDKASAPLNLAIELANFEEVSGPEATIHFPSVGSVVISSFEIFIFG